MVPDEVKLARGWLSSPDGEREGALPSLVVGLLGNRRNSGRSDGSAAIHDHDGECEGLLVSAVKSDLHGVGVGSDLGSVIKLVEDNLLGGGVVILDQGVEVASESPVGPDHVVHTPGVGGGGEERGEVEAITGFGPESVGVVGGLGGHGDEAVVANVGPRDSPRPSGVEIVTFNRLRSHLHRVGSELAAVLVLCDRELFVGFVVNDHIGHAGVDCARNQHVLAVSLSGGSLRETEGNVECGVSEGLANSNTIIASDSVFKATAV